MSAAASPSEILAVCRADPDIASAEAPVFVHLCAELSAGEEDGRRHSVPGELDLRKPGATDSDSRLPAEDFLGDDGPERIAEAVFQRLDRCGALQQLRVALGEPGQGLEEIFSGLGIAPLDLLPVAHLSRTAEQLAGRKFYALPEYFRPLVEHYGAQVLLANLADPRRLEVPV